MGDLLHETTPPLAWNQEGLLFQPPPQTVAWKIRRYTGNRGRPPIVWDGQGPAHLSLEASMDDLRAKVANVPGSYRLFPVDDLGQELEPVACIELTPSDGANELAVIGQTSAAAVPQAPISGQSSSIDAMELCQMMVASRDAHDAVMANMLTTLVQSTAAIQQSMAALMTVTNNTINVASGLDAVKRLPPPKPEVNPEKIAEKLAEMLVIEEPEAEPEAQEPPKKGSFFGTLMTNPMLSGLAMSFVEPLQEKNKAQVEVAKATTRAAQAQAEAAEAGAEAAKAARDKEQALAAAARAEQDIAEDRLIRYAEAIRDASGAESNDDDDMDDGPEGGVHGSVGVEDDYDDYEDVEDSADVVSTDDDTGDGDIGIDADAGPDSGHQTTEYDVLEPEGDEKLSSAPSET